MSKLVVPFLFRPVSRYIVTFSDNRSHSRVLAVGAVGEKKGRKKSTKDQSSDIALALPGPSNVIIIRGREGKEG